MRLAARFKRVYGDARGAAAIYERLIAATPEDTEALAGLIRSLALVDPAQAEKYESAMPEVTPAGDVDAIETQTVLRTFRSARVAAGAADGVARSGRGTGVGGTARGRGGARKRLAARASSTI